MVNIPLPAIKPDDNAVQFISDFLDSLVYRHPTPGFKARVAVLISLDCLYLLLDFVYFTMTVRRILKVRGRSGLWIFRKTRRGNQQYVVSHVRLLRPILTFAQGTFGIVWAVNCWHVYGRRQSQRDSWGLRSFQFLPIFITGWVISCAIMQSYLLTTAEKRKHRYSPALINWTLAIIGIVLTFWQFGLGIWSTVRGNQLWDLYPTAQREFAALEAQGKTDLSALLQLLPLYRDFLVRADRYQDAMTAQFLSLWTLPFACFALNLYGVALARRLTREIKQRECEFQRVQVIFGSVESPEKLPDDSNLSEPKDSKDIDLQLPEAPSYLTNQHLRCIAARQFTGTYDEAAVVQAQEILDLKRAARDLWTNCATILFASVQILGATIYLAWWISTGRIINGSWPTYETALFLIQWMMSILLNATFAALILNEWKLRSATDLTINPSPTIAARLTSKVRSISFSSSKVNVKVSLQRRTDSDTNEKESPPPPLTMHVV
ncbi:hypothetical protein OIV83_005481 [Microbotryomycetes sp. JL201]|nr:hypothetical protein OIV83_005481 [Microbotryomycetes sp. JL201]